MEKRHMKQWSILLILFSFSIVLSQQYYFRHFTIKDGLAQSQVQSIIQDKDGYLWFGTLDGLSRFDGQNFTNFTLKDGLAGTDISVSVQDAQGTIWFGHENGGITIYNPETHQFHPFIPRANTPGSAITDILIDRQNRFWFGTFSTGLYLLQGDSLVQFTTKDGLGSMRIGCLYQMPDGTIWIGHEGGITVLKDPEHFSPETTYELPGIDDFKHDLITKIFLDDSSRIWVGNQLSGVYLLHYPFRPEAPVIHHFTTKNGLPNNWIVDFLQDSSGNIWIATFGGGLVQLQEKDHLFHPRIYNMQNGLPYDQIATLYQDREGNIWIGTYGGGVAQFLGNRFVFVTQTEGLLDNAVWAIHRDSFGDLWFGNNMGFTYFPDRGKSHYNGKPHPFAIGTQVISIVEDRWHNLYFATYGKGLYRLNLDTGHITRFTVKDGLPTNYISHICPDKKGNFLLTTFKGNLVQFKPKPTGKLQFHELAHTPVPIFSLFPEENGTIWLGTEGKGLFKYQDGILTQVLDQYDNNFLYINSMDRDSRGTLWLSTAGVGLFAFREDTLIHYTTDDGLSTENCIFVLVDDFDNVWVGHSRGVDKFDGKRFEFYRQQDGFIGIESNQNACYKDPAGYLWFGTIGGAIRYDPREDRKILLPPLVNISKIELFHKSIPWDTLRVFKPNQDFFTFYFVGINFYSPQNIKYSYILEGFDHQWSPPSPHRYATYSNVPYGKYVFKVKACLNDTLWSENVAAYRFTIQTPFFKSRLFFSLLAITFIFLVVTGYRLRIQAIEKRNRFLEEKVRERTRDIYQEKKKTEEAFRALQESEAKFKALAESTSSAIFIYQGEYFKYVNPATEQITGYPREELLKMKFWELVHSDFQEQIRNAGLARQRGEFVAPLHEIKIIRKDGQIRWIHFTATRIIYQNAPAALGTAFDITERKLAEEALRESEIRYRLLFDMLPFGGEILNENGIIMDCSTSETQLLGYSRKELIGKHITEFMAPESIHIFKKEYSSLLKGQTIQMEITMVHKNGRRIHVARAARPFYKQDGTLWGIIALNNDITEQKNMEQALRENEERLRTLINAMPDSVCFKDGQGRWLEANEFNLKLFGLLNVPYQGKKDTELAKYNEFYREVLENNEKTDEITWERGTLYRAEEIIKQPDGSVKVFDVIKVPIFFPDGSRKGLVVIGRDITERKAAENALREEKEKLSVTLQSIGEAVIAIDRKSRIMILNRAAQELIGWSEQEALGRDISEVVQPLSPETGEPIPPITEKLFRTGEKTTCTEDLKIIAKDGQEKFINETAAPIFDESDKIIGAVVVYRDITERRHLENELIKMQKLESLGILAGGIAHDFNNILTAIMGNISLAKMNIEETHPVYQRLEEAENAAIRARDLTQQLLTFSKGGAPVKKTTSISEIILESTRFTLSGSNVGFKTFFDRDLWPVEVDEGQISQVIQNLVINAQQAMPDGGYIEIYARNVEIGEHDKLPLRPGKYVELQFKDHGHGIPEKYLSRIFDPYFTTKQQGSGLGLATTYSIIKKHNGYITVESRVNQGTTFTIYLPASRKKKDHTRVNADQSAIFKGCVLIMDDEEDVQKILGSILEFLGFSVDFASDGKEAIEKYRTAQKKGTPYVLTIMDLTVPKGMGGQEAILHLKQLDPNIKAIVSSGYSNDTVISEFKKYGFCGYIAKPFKVDELRKVIAEVLKT